MIIPSLSYNVETGNSYGNSDLTPYLSPYTKDIDSFGNYESTRKEEN